MKKLTELVVSGLLTLNGCANNIYLPQSPQHAPPSGEIIIFKSWPDVKGSAQADYSNGFPIVFYAPSEIGRYPEEFQRFIFYHEVGHVKKKHITLENLTVPESRRVQAEWEADCYSLNVLRNELNYTPDQMFIVYEFADVFLERGRLKGMSRCPK